MQVMAASTTAGRKMLAGRKTVRSKKPYSAFFVLKGIVRRDGLGDRSAGIFNAEQR
jgi:hypothetical protein